MNANVQRYNRVAIALHWVTAILMLYMLVWGEGLMKGQPWNKIAPTNPGLHVSLGLTVLVLTVLRLVWRLINPPPPDVPMSALQQQLSHAMHWAFYALLLLIPVSGLAGLGRWFTRHTDITAVSFFGLFDVPALPVPLLGGAHDLFTKLMWALLALHVLAALKHQFMDKDDLMKRMSLR
ncbi:MAG: cytochrome b/b6 domain-containing protein [Alphaproteobacteria bacterium]|nr:cytochrome b/b6 domain-containing protein [Alphaproteobacteria bacterium]